MWNAYSDDDPGRPVEPDPTAGPGTVPAPPAGLDPQQLVVDGERFVVTRRADSTATYDFDWVSHPASYGFSVGGAADWRPSRADLVEQIRGFLGGIDRDTGYLRD